MAEMSAETVIRPEPYFRERRSKEGKATLPPCLLASLPLCFAEELRTTTPFAPRPEDAARQAELDKMKRRATGLLLIAALVFLAASWFEAQYPWLGYVRATSEASVVGGLADW